MGKIRSFIRRAKNFIKRKLGYKPSKQALRVVPPACPCPPEYTGRPLYGMLSQCKSVCYIGDSVTEGNENGGHGWYEPLAAILPGHVRQWVFAQGGATSRFFLENVHKYAKLKADAYILAFGTNDVRYRNPEVCAMDTAAFIERVDAIVRTIRRKKKGSRVVFVAPWTTRQVDPISVKLTREERFRMLAEYATAIKEYAAANGCLYLDPTEQIQRELQKGEDLLLVDHIHPNADSGIRTYSQAVLDATLQGGV